MVAPLLTNLLPKKQWSFVLTLIVWLCLNADSKIIISVFPLQNTSNNPLYEWVAFSSPEYIFRTLRHYKGFRLWDPVEIFSIDSSCKGIVADSILKKHRQRWEWDISITGEYSISNDTVTIKIRTNRFYNNVMSKKELELKGTRSSFFDLSSKLVLEFLTMAGYKADRADSIRILRPPATSVEAYALYAAGYGYEMNRNPEAAISAYLQAVEIDRSFVLPLIRIGEIYSVASHTKSAEFYFEKALDAAKTDPYVVASVAKFYADHAMLEQASKFIKNHNSLLQSTADGLAALGSFYFSDGEYQRANAMFAKAIAGGCTNLDVQFSLGKTLFVTGQFDMAVEVFNRLISFRPGYMPYYSYLGVAYRQVGQYMESVTILKAALAISPADINCAIALAQTYFHLQLYLEAEQVLKRSLELNPDMASLMLNLGILYLHINRIEEAKKLINRAASSSFNRQVLYNNQGNLFFSAGNLGKALKMYRKADKSGKKRQEILYNMAIALLAMKDLEGAFECFDQILSMAPGRLDILLRQAELSLAIGNEKRAEECYRTLLNRSPFNKDARKKFIAILKRQGRFEEMADLCEGYLKKFPGDKYFRQQLALAYTEMGWHDVAFMKYQEIIKDFPNDYNGYLGAGKCLYAIAEKKNKPSIYNEAAVMLKRTTELNSAEPEAYFFLGLIASNYRRDRSAAIAYWQKALELASDPVLVNKIKKLIAEANQS